MFLCLCITVFFGIGVWPCMFKLIILRVHSNSIHLKVLNFVFIIFVFYIIPVSLCGFAGKQLFNPVHVIYISVIAHSQSSFVFTFQHPFLSDPSREITPSFFNLSICFCTAEGLICNFSDSSFRVISVFSTMSSSNLTTFSDHLNQLSD